MSHVYFAYGSNLDPEQFAARCPDSRPLCVARLRGWRLRFAGGGHADIVPGSAQDVVWGALYECSDADMRALDRYEGVRWSAPDTGYYRRWIVAVETDEGERDAEVYVMTPGHQERAPHDGYVAIIRAGYRAWGIRARSAVLRAILQLVERERFAARKAARASARPA